MANVSDLASDVAKGEPRPSSSAPLTRSYHADKVCNNNAEFQEVQRALTDDYRLRLKVARGGFGTVWIARDKTFRWVAVKVIKDTEAERTNREFEAMRMLAKYGRTPKCYALKTHTPPHLIIMEYIRGRDLETVLDGFRKKNERVSIPYILHIGSEIAKGLCGPHKTSTAHRDLKPGNIRLRKKDGRVYIMDFGLALLPDVSPLTSEGRVVGTLCYMSPEQLNGKPCWRSDLWALGAILFEMIEGRAAFRRTTDGETRAAIFGERPKIQRDDAPKALKELVESLLSQNAGERPTAQEAVECLSRLSSQAASRSNPNASRLAVACVLITISFSPHLPISSLGEPEPRGAIDPPVVVPEEFHPMAQPVAGAPAPDPKILREWERAGARLGRMKTAKPEVGRVSLEEHIPSFCSESKAEDGLLAFRFSDASRLGEAFLRDPGVPFAVIMHDARLADPLVVKLAALPNLHTLELIFDRAAAPAAKTPLLALPLTVLAVHDRSYSATTQSQILAIKGLRKLDLTETPIDAQQMKALAVALRDVETIVLGYRHRGKVGIAAGGELKKLDAGERELPRLPAALGELRSLSKLRTIFLTECALTDDAVVALANADLLHRLANAQNRDGGRAKSADDVYSFTLVDFPNVSDEGVRRLSVFFPKLKQLFLENGSRISARAIDDLRAKTHCMPPVFFDRRRMLPIDPGVPIR